MWSSLFIAIDIYISLLCFFFFLVLLPSREIAFPKLRCLWDIVSILGLGNKNKIQACLFFVFSDAKAATRIAKPTIIANQHAIDLIKYCVPLRMTV